MRNANRKAGLDRRYGKRGIFPAFQAVERLMTDPILCTTSDGVLNIHFNRPEKKNALTNAMYGAWADAMEAAAHDPGVRAILFTAAGDAFTSGNDIMDFAQVATGALTQADMQVGRVLKALAYAEKPLVAAVTGVAVGIGATMLLHCDLVYCADEAKISTPFVSLALAPEAASSLLLPQAIGAKRAYAMFALGEALTGKEAEAFGLVTRSLPRDQVEAAAREAAQRLVRLPAGALKQTKLLMRDAQAIAALMDREGQVFNQQLLSGEAKEAFSAFFERRAPDFIKVA